VIRKISEKFWLVRRFLCFLSIKYKIVLLFRLMSFINKFRVFSLTKMMTCFHTENMFTEDQ
jgi:hypothetical protein